MIGPDSSHVTQSETSRSPAPGIFTWEPEGNLLSLDTKLWGWESATGSNGQNLPHSEIRSRMSQREGNLKTVIFLEYFLAIVIGLAQRKSYTNSLQVWAFLRPTSQSITLFFII